MLTLWAKVWVGEQEEPLQVYRCPLRTAVKLLRHRSLVLRHWCQRQKAAVTVNHVQADGAVWQSQNSNIHPVKDYLESVSHRLCFILQNYFEHL